MVSYGSWSFSTDSTLENSRLCEFFETVSEDFGIRISDRFTDFFEAMMTLIDSLEDENDPLLPEESEERLSFGTTALGSLDHGESIMNT